jgi:hypothetical protein
LLTATAIAIGATSMWHVPASAQQPGATQSSVVRGVTVKATPTKLTASETEFAVVLDTHSEDLKDDLEKSAILVIGGRELAPLKWQGPPAGGHHREGVLRFPSVFDVSGPAELRITRAGESAPRVFRWESLQKP